MKTFKRIALILLAVAMLCSVIVPSSATVYLSDIQGHWAQEYIEYWVERGVIGGYPDGTFHPNQKITRAEACKVLTVAYEMPTDVEPTAFTDVAASSWYYGYVQTCAAFGSVNGYPDGSFKPEGNITRNEAVKMVCLSAGLSERDTGCEIFVDYEEVADWAKGYWNALYHAGAIHGCDGGVLRSEDYITRAEFVKILCFVFTEVKIYEMSLSIQDNLGNVVSDKTSYLTGDACVVSTLVPMLIANRENFAAVFPSGDMRDLLDAGVAYAQAGYADGWTEEELAVWQNYLDTNFGTVGGERPLIDLLTDVVTTVSAVARSEDYVMTFYDTEEDRTDVQYTVTIRVDVMD